MSIFRHCALGLEGLSEYRGQRCHHYRSMPLANGMALSYRNRMYSKKFESRVHIVLLLECYGLTNSDLRVVATEAIRRVRYLIGRFKSDIFQLVR